jgi:sugar-specific transcriptional regulator TrmB
MEEKVMMALNAVGLSQKEAIVYTSLVEYGDSPVKKITQVSKLNRVTIYPIIQSLIEKGFVSKFSMNKRTYFRAIKPANIIKLLKEKENKFNSILPILESAKKKMNETTSIEIFNGIKLMSSFLETLYLSGEKEFWAYGNGDEIEKKMINISLNARNMRIINKIKLNTIVNDIRKDYTLNQDYKKITNVRINPQLNKFNIYIIFGKQIVGIQESSNDFIGIIIRNEEIAKYHKAVYDLYEKSSKKII